MSYNSKSLITDSTGVNPVPQYYNPSSDAYEPLEGQDNSSYSIVNGKNVLVANASVNFVSNATANTVENATITLPTLLQKDAIYLISINNPSSLGSAVNVTLNNGMLFATATPVYCEVFNVDVPSGTAKCYVVQGWLLGDSSAQISVKNDTTVSSSGGTVTFEITAI